MKKFILQYEMMPGQPEPQYGLVVSFVGSFILVEEIENGVTKRSRTFLEVK